MHRLFWFIAGGVVTYILEGYLEGMLDTESDSSDKIASRAEGKA